MSLAWLGHRGNGAIMGRTRADVGHAHVTQHTITCTLAHGGSQGPLFGWDSCGSGQRGSISPPRLRHCHHRVRRLGIGEGPRRPDATPRRLSDVGTTAPLPSIPYRRLSVSRLNATEARGDDITLEMGATILEWRGSRAWALQLGREWWRPCGGAPLLGGLVRHCCSLQVGSPEARCRRPWSELVWHVPRLLALGDVPRRRFPLVGHLAAAVEGRGRGNVG